MSASPTSSDAFERVSAALVSVWPTVADADAGLTRAELGRVLDECGSDYRPLVDLLLDLGRLVRPALSGVGPQSMAAWTHRRAPLVHKIVSTRYLQPDVARWAVDVWGRVLQVAPIAAASPTVAVASETDTAASPALSRHAGALPSAHRGATAPAGTTGGPALRPAVLAPQQVPAAMKQRPSWAGGPVSFGVGQRPSSAGLAALAQSGRVVVRGTVPAGPRFQPAERRAALVLGLLLVIVTVGLLNAFRQRPDVTTPVDAGGAESAESATTGAGDTGAGATGAGTTGAGTTGTATTEAPTAEALTAGDRTADIRAAEALTAGDRTAGGWGAVRDVGVGGAYVVSQRIRDVSGSATCDAVASALAGGRESRETVSHTPGQAVFTLVSRGVTGTLDRDGQFVSEPLAGTTNHVNWRFVMRGRFGPDGFTGESVTHTDAILRWGKIQTCVVTADLIGQRRQN